MRIDRSVVEGVRVLSLAEPAVVGRRNAREFEESLLEGMDADPFLVLDASRIRFFESEGMDSLLAVRDRLERLRGAMAITGLSRTVLQVFRLAGLDCALNIYPDLPRAVLGILRTRGDRVVWH